VLDLDVDQVRNALIYLIAFVAAVSVHEFGHAFIADKLGDRLPRIQGRLTLSPARHIDPLGTIVLPLAGALMSTANIPMIAWGKPVMTSPNNYTPKLSRRTGSMLVALAGPMMNLLLALVGSLAFIVAAKAGASEGVRDGILQFVLRLNITLMFFNLLPIGPLDGATVLAGVLPRSMDRFVDWNQRYGTLILLVLLVAPTLHLPGLGVIMAPAIRLADAWGNGLEGMVTS
jgi:Zn-dependent protease